MEHFVRAVRLALKYRWTLAGGLICSLLVAVLWGANIGAVYPIVEVIFRGESLQEWVAEHRMEAAHAVDVLDDQLASLHAQQQAATSDALRADIARNIAEKQHRLQVETASHEWYAWLEPHINAWLPAQPFETLVLVVAFLFFGSLLKDLFLLLNTLFVERLSSLAVLDLRRQFFRRTLKLDLATFGDDRTSSLMARFTSDCEAVRGGLNNLFGASVREPLKAIACLIGAAYVCWPLLLVSLVITPLAALLVHLLTVALRRATRRAMEEVAELYSVLSESFNGIEAVKAYTMERRERQRFHHTSKRWFHRLMRIAFYTALTKPAMEMMGVAVICLALLAGCYLVLNQETHLFGLWMSDRPLSLGALMVFYGMLAGAADPVRRLTEIWALIQKGIVASDRVYELLDREPAVADPVDPRPMPARFSELVLDNVSFHYTPDQPVLRNISLRIGSQETIAIVGPNGCGKTTLARMVLRFYDPTEGAIRLDGIDLRELRLRDLRQRQGLVAQQAHLFDDTVLDNIRYGSPHASEEEAIAAAKQAHAHRFITEKLPQGYETIVGQGGSKLSGGQRQRIALARAILRDPQMLLLDEATSQVDLESEQAVHQALSTFVRGRLTVIITHRLSTLALADRIIVMDAGQVLDIGSHDELARRCPLYGRLYSLHSAKIA